MTRSQKIVVYGMLTFAVFFWANFLCGAPRGGFEALFVCLFVVTTLIKLSGSGAAIAVVVYSRLPLVPWLLSLLIEGEWLRSLQSCLYNTLDIVTALLPILTVVWFLAEYVSMRIAFAVNQRKAKRLRLVYSLSSPFVLAYLIGLLR